jgi:hypothetical protein
MKKKNTFQMCANMQIFRTHIHGCMGIHVHVICTYIHRCKESYTSISLLYKHSLFVCTRRSYRGSLYGALMPHVQTLTVCVHTQKLSRKFIRCIDASCTNTHCLCAHAEAIAEDLRCIYASCINTNCLCAHAEAIA